jgi:hypothetical protein
MADGIGQGSFGERISLALAAAGEPGYGRSGCVDKGLRSFLRQIVPNAALDDPVSVFAREFIGIGTGIRVRCTVVVTFKCFLLGIYR